MDEAKAIQARLRGEYAEKQYGELRSAFEQIEADYVSQWKTTTDPDAREGLWRAVRVVAEVHKHFEKVIAGGRVAATDLARLAAVTRN